MEESNVEQTTPPIDPQDNNLQKPIVPFYQNKPLLGIIVFILIGIVSYLIIYFQQNQSAENASVDELSPTISTTKKQPYLSPTESSTPTEAPEYKVIPTVAATVIPTYVPAATNTPAPAATNTPVPRTANPPKMKITYPSEGQSIEMNSSQTFCAVEVPDGGDHAGLQKRVNINNSGWTGYGGSTTTCFSPTEGQNNVKMQFKNTYGEESSEYGVNFTFHRTE